MRVRFGRLVGVACLIGAAGFALLAVLSDRVSFVGALAPVVFLGFGVALLARSYLSIDENAIVVHALIGRAQHTYGLGAADTIEFDGARVVLVSAIGRRRLQGVTGWLANRRDWVAFRAWAERRRAGAHSAG